MLGEARGGWGRLEKAGESTGRGWREHSERLEESTGRGWGRLEEH